MSHGPTPSMGKHAAICQGRLVWPAVSHYVSPHCDARPDATPVSVIVVHGITVPPGVYGGEGVIRLFMGKMADTRIPEVQHLRHVRVSSHLFIRRDGAVLQFVAFHQRAWHAGVSSFRGRTACNNFSVGIELEGEDQVPYTMAQYRRLSDCVCALQLEYPMITMDNVVGHSDIAPGRKTDPGPAFRWDRLRQMITEKGKGGAIMPPSA